MYHHGIVMVRYHTHAIIKKFARAARVLAGGRRLGFKVRLPSGRLAAAQHKVDARIGGRRRRDPSSQTALALRMQKQYTEQPPPNIRSTSTHPPFHTMLTPILYLSR